MKKLNKLFAILVAMAMVLSLGATMAFADDLVGTAGFKVTKNLTLSGDLDPKDVTGTVRFNVTKTAENGNAIADESQTIVTYEDITFGENGTAYEANGTTDTTATYAYMSDYITPAELGLANAAAGIYEFKITEASTDVASNSGNTDVYTPDSNQEFTLQVRKDKTGNYYYTASHVVVTPAAEEGGEPTEEIVKDEIKDDKSNELQFTNTLYDIRKTTEKENAAFLVTKTVDDKANIYEGDGFKFNISVKLPEMAKASDIVAVKYTPGENGAAGTETTWSFPADYAYTGAAYEVELKAGEGIYFKEIPAGTKITAVETDNRAGTTADNTKSYLKSGTEYTTEEQIQKNGQLKAEVTNTSKTTTFEGVLTTNLPYIVLALVAIGGMVAYVVVRRRNADEA